MIFAKKKKKKLVWCDDPPEDRVISIVAGCLANHDRAHSQQEWRNPVYVSRVDSLVLVFESFIPPILIYKSCLSLSLS
jgi:hypothetical protein